MSKFFVFLVHISDFSETLPIWTHWKTSSGKGFYWCINKILFCDAFSIFLKCKYIYITGKEILICFRLRAHPSFGESFAVLTKVLIVERFFYSRAKLSCLDIGKSFVYILFVKKNSIQVTQSINSCSKETSSLLRFV